MTTTAPTPAEPPPVADPRAENLLKLQSLRDRAEREPEGLDEEYWRERSSVYAACLLATCDFGPKGPVERP